MNILIPDSWLREYLKTKLRPEEIAAEGSLHGPSFERWEEVEGEIVYEAEVTTNRVDSMSIKGLARELGAILGKRGELVAPTRARVKKQAASASLPLPKVTVETKFLKKVVTVVLDQVENGPSPDWMQRRLRQIGQNSHKVIIDTTNYLTHELGHPCHAFDYDKVMALGGEIIVKVAEKGKEFITLDGESYQTLGGEVVFENRRGEIIDLPAIKGTANTAIDEGTKRVLFWLESLEAKVVREASMNHAIRTVAAVLNEKNVDPALMEETLALGAALLQEWAGAQVASEVYVWQRADLVSERTVQLTRQRLGEYLGVELSGEEVKRKLRALGFILEKESKTSWWWRVPSYRLADIEIEQDLIEEVARLYGYHLLPSRTDFAVVQIPPQEGIYLDLESKFKHFLAAQGWAEVYTYSMVAAELFEAVDPKSAAVLKIANPLTEDRVMMRQVLWPSLLEVYEKNLGRTEGIRGVFEVAKVYLPGVNQTKVEEKVVLGLVSPLPYRGVRALLEQLLRLVYLEVTVSQEGEIRAKEGEKERLGMIKLVGGQKLAVELELAVIGRLARGYPVIRQIPQQPIIVEDLTFVVKKGVAVGLLIEKMVAVSPLLRKVTLKDIYQDHYTFNYVYQDLERALTNEEVGGVRAKVVRQMEKAGLVLVGKLGE